MRYGINAVIVVHNNGGLNQDRRGDEAAYVGREGGNPDELWRFTDTTFAQIAESMGAPGIRVTDTNKINSALNQAVSANRPTVADIVSDGDVAAVGAVGALIRRKARICIIQKTLAAIIEQARYSRWLARRNQA